MKKEICVHVFVCKSNGREVGSLGRVRMFVVMRQAVCSNNCHLLSHAVALFLTSLNLSPNRLCFELDDYFHSSFRAGCARNYLTGREKHSKQGQQLACVHELTVVFYDGLPQVTMRCLPTSCAVSRLFLVRPSWCCRADINIARPTLGGDRDGSYASLRDRDRRRQTE